MEPFADRCPQPDARATNCAANPDDVACYACYDERTPRCDEFACRTQSTGLLACANANKCMTPEGWVDWTCGITHCKDLLTGYVSCVGGCPSLELCNSPAQANCCGLDARKDKVFHSSTCANGICEHEYTRINGDGSINQTFVATQGAIDAQKPFEDMAKVRSASSYRGIWKTDCTYLEIQRCSGKQRELYQYRYEDATLKTALYPMGETVPRPERTFEPLAGALPVAPDGWDTMCGD